jgi:hypothetical protein
MKHNGGQRESMATISLRMISISRVKGARHQSIPALIQLSRHFFDVCISLGIFHICLLTSDLLYKLKLQN